MSFIIIISNYFRYNASWFSIRKIRVLNYILYNVKYNNFLLHSVDDDCEDNACYHYYTH